MPKTKFDTSDLAQVFLDYGRFEAVARRTRRESYNYITNFEPRIRIITKPEAYDVLYDIQTACIVKFDITPNRWRTADGNRAGLSFGQGAETAERFRRLLDKPAYEHRRYDVYVAWCACIDLTTTHIRAFLRKDERYSAKKYAEKREAAYKAFLLASRRLPPKGLI